MKCVNCGQELNEGVKFCTNCGTPRETSQVQDATAQEAPNLEQASASSAETEAAPEQIEATDSLPASDQGSSLTTEEEQSQEPSVEPETATTEGYGYTYQTGAPSKPATEYSYPNQSGGQTSSADLGDNYPAQNTTSAPLASNYQGQQTVQSNYQPEGYTPPNQGANYQPQGANYQPGDTQYNYGTGANSSNRSNYYNPVPQNTGYPSPQQKPNGDTSLALISMIVGIVALLFGCCVPIISILGGIAAVVLGIIVFAQKKDGQGMAIAGIICGVIALVLGLIVTISGGLLTAFINEILREFQY